MTVSNLQKVPLIFVFLLVAIFFKQLLWQAIVPIWQGPDEQAHFAQLQYFAEKNTFPVAQKDLSAEVNLSEELLGTKRDNQGNNQFTYHPEYKIPYSKTTTGIYEKLIDFQPLSSRTDMVGKEAAGYPPLYYVLDRPFYFLVYSSGLIDRVFSARQLSLLLHLALIFVAYSVGLLIWKKTVPALVLAILVSFQPMISFTAGSVHPDNLLFLIYSLIFLVCLKIISEGLSFRKILALVILSVLGWWTKQFIIFILPIAGAAVFYRVLPGKLGKVLALVSLVSLPLTFFLQLPFPYMTHVSPASPLYSMNFLDYLHFRLPKLAFEMWPWYWGVFKWLGVTLPLPLLRIITRVTVILGLGIVIRLFQIFRSQKPDLANKVMIFSLVAIISYVLSLFVWDWRLMQSQGYSLGLQGRYLLPLIIPQMILAVFGLDALIPKRIFFLKPYFLIFFSAAAIVLNSIALAVVAQSYYSLRSFNVFVVQASQYKPDIFKGQNLEVLIFLTLLTSILLLFSFILSVRSQPSRQH